MLLAWHGWRALSRRGGRAFSEALERLGGRAPLGRKRGPKPKRRPSYVWRPEWHFLKREQGRSPDRRGRSNMAEARSKAERGRAPLGTANASSKASTSADIPSAEQGLGLAELLCAHGVYSQPRGFSLCQVLKEGPFVWRPRNR